MDYHHFTILFVVVFLAFSLRATVVVARYEQTADNYTQTERSFYAAADAAGEALCQYGGSGVISDKGAAYEAFIDSMYASLGIMDDPAKREEFLNYIPMFAVLEEDGFYIYFTDEYEKSDGYHYVTKNWSECVPYCYSDNDFVYRFTLSGMVTIFDRNGLIDGTKRLYQATQDELLNDAQYNKLRLLRPNSFLLDEEDFTTIKQTAVITSIQDAMRYYINNHNRVANEYGIAYDFALPIIDNSTWARSIEHPGVLVMIQGYPINATQRIFYNQYAFVGAQIYKQEPYYVTEWGWHPTYHRAGCRALDFAEEEVFLNPYAEVEDCVKKGAFACEECIPDGIYAPETIYPMWTWE